MKKQYIEILKDLFRDMSSMTPETLQSFLGQTMQYLEGLKKKFSSTDEQEREEAMKEAMNLKEVLEGQMTHFSQMLGMDFSQLSETDFFKGMNEQEKEVFAEAKERFNTLTKGK